MSHPWLFYRAPHPWALPLLHLPILPHTKNTQYIQHISKFPQSTSCAIKNHSGVKICRVAETRAPQLPQVMSPMNLRFVSRIEAYSGDPNQSFDVQEKVGEEDHRALITEEVEEFREIGTPSLPDSEISETSYFQSQKHFDDSVESTADSDLEDGELQKMLTSPLYAQEASEKPDAMVMQEREVRWVHNTLKPIERKVWGLIHLKARKLSRKPMHCFRLNREIWSGVPCSDANPSNLRGSLLEGTKDHMLNQARSSLAKQELHVESLSKYIGELQWQTEEQK